MIDDYNTLFGLFDPEEYYSREVEPLGEMATICTTTVPRKLRIQVNPSRDKKGSPYFKVFTTPNFTDDTRVARLHFFDTGMEYHQDKFKDWIITNKDCNDIIEILKMDHHEFPIYSNWQMACYLWNMEYGVINIQDKDKYMNGEFDKEFSDKKMYPSYVPSTTSIPEKWIYNPPKNKSKRK